ncbi:T6SS immunity protein Tli4 family protein [Pseudomonas sp.]|jgi:hypothetical protein|uniref:T6SS immunity protein Tli4 family protein n=1 Tax=Pseudomonas sp. TaxID=306 RepID=UPI003266640E
MKLNIATWAISIFLTTTNSFASSTRTECLGRITFNTPEDIAWATFPVNDYPIGNTGGSAFTKNIVAVGDSTIYQYDELIVKVSDITASDEFDRQRNYILHKAKTHKKELEDDISEKQDIINDLSTIQDDNDVKNTIIRLKENIKKTESEIPQAVVYEHDLGIADAYILGSKSTPHDVLLYRNKRIYYFSMNNPAADSAQRIKGLIARFEPRDLYQVPKGPGVCIPYGFIHDDGKTSFSVKNSLRFTSTPNVIMSIINSSQDDPTKATTGTYDTDHRPGYDAEKWKKSKILEKFYFGERMTTLEGWRLDPRPESGEQERAWFAIAHVGGLASPLMAVQMFTFKQGTDGLKDLTPPPEAVIPRFLKLTESIKPQ